MTIDNSEATGFEGFEPIDEIELTKEEKQTGIVSLLGVLPFEPNLAQKGGAVGFEKNWKYGIEMLVPKGSDDAVALWAVCKAIAVKAWGEDSQKEFDIATQVASGFKGRSSGISITDGDQDNPTYNRGCWIVRAKSDAQPVILDARGRVVTDPAQFPGVNWGVRAIVEIWASKGRDRVNLRLLAVQGVQPQARQVGRSQEDTLALVQAVTARLPALPANAFGRAPRPAQSAIPAEAPAAPPARRQAAPVAPPAASRRKAAPAPAVDPDAFFRGEVETPEEPAAPKAARPHLRRA